MSPIFHPVSTGGEHYSECEMKWVNVRYPHLEAPSLLVSDTPRANLPCFQIHLLRSPILPIPSESKSFGPRQHCRNGAYAPTLRSVNPSGWWESKSACDELKTRVWKGNATKVGCFHSVMQEQG
jgi:hypothetical protein